MRLWILSLAVLAICFISGEGKCANRDLDFQNQDLYEFTANDNKKKAIKALTGSGEILKGRKGDTIWLQLRYVYERQHYLENHGFKGKVCFEIQGASMIDIGGTGIAYCWSTCSKKQYNKQQEQQEEGKLPDSDELIIPCEAACNGGGVYKDMIEIKEEKRGSFKEYCVKATGNTQLGLGLIADGDERVQVQNFSIKACEVINKPEYDRT